MRPSRTAVVLLAFAVLLAACSGDTSATSTCLAGDPNCADDGTGGAGPIPLDASDVLSAADDGPLWMSFGGYLLIDESGSRLCTSLAESFPPQCGAEVIRLAASTDDVLEAVREAFGDPATAPIRNEGSVWWTEEWVNVEGLLEGDVLVIDD